VIDSILDLITTLAWLLLAASTTAFFVRTAWQKGIKVAIVRLLSFRILLPLLLVLCLGILSASLVFIEPQKVGVVISVTSAEGFRYQPFRSGLHWIIPMAEHVITYPISWQNYTISNKPMEGMELGDDSIVARTKDGQEVSIDCSVIFRLDPEQVIWVHISWQDRYIQDLVRPVVRGVVRTKVADFTVEEVNSNKRGDLEAFLDRRLRELFEDKGLILDQFILRNIAFSPEYADAVEQKQVAEQIKIQRDHEAEQIRRLARGQADRVIILAEAEAQSIEIKAQAEANARLIQAEAEAKALKLIADALAQNSDLLTYQYINKLSPNISVMLLPSDTPLLLPMPTPPSPAEASSPILTPTETLTPTLTP